MPFTAPGTPSGRPEPPRAERYRSASGQFLPSVTTILDIINKPGIAGWANRLGMFDHVEYESHLNSLARAGTLLHAKIEAHFRGLPEPDESEYSDDECRNAFASFFHFEAWRKTHSIKPLALERKLVSEVHGYGGTVDLLAEVDGQNMLLDWKSSSKPRMSHLLQLSAYQVLVRENLGANLAVAVVCLPRIGGGYSETRLEPNDELEALFQNFLAAKTLHDHTLRVEKLGLL